MCSIRPRSAAAAIDHATDLGLVDEFTTVSAFARKPVKITMTGPHLLAAVAYDEYYHDLPRMMTDLGKLLHQNFRRLAEAGCKHIQIDEPYFTVADDQEVRAAVAAINIAVEGLPDDVHVLVHICQGNYAVGPDYDGQIGHRYFDTGRYKADIVAGIECDGFLIEHDMTPHYEGLLGNRQLGVGAVDVQDPNVETGQQVADRIKAHRWLDARADHHHQLLRLQSSAAAHRARQASCHAGGQSDSQRQRGPVGPSMTAAPSDGGHVQASLRLTEERLRLAEETAGIGAFDLDLTPIPGYHTACCRAVRLRSVYGETGADGVGARHLRR